MLYRISYAFDLTRIDNKMYRVSQYHTSITQTTSYSQLKTT